MEIYSDINTLKRKVGIIDIYKLERLVKKSNLSKLKIKGKDVILVIGKTGVGKTSTILRLLGHTFKKIKVRGGLVDKYQPEGKLSPEH